MNYLLLASAKPGLGGMLTGMLPMVLIFAIFYFIVFAPIRKRQRALDEVIRNLGKGAKVVTNGGLHGEVVKAEGDILVVRIADNVKVRISKSAVAGLAGTPQEK